MSKQEYKYKSSYYVGPWRSLAQLEYMVLKLILICFEILTFLLLKVNI